MIPTRAKSVAFFPDLGLIASKVRANILSLFTFGFLPTWRFFRCDWQQGCYQICSVTEHVLEDFIQWQDKFVFRNFMCMFATGTNADKPDLQ